ncbi:MAG: Ig-like domain-containing protein [Gammaproteobacteria bacterium]
MKRTVIIAIVWLLSPVTLYAQAFVAQFDPAAGVIPTPNNLLFNGSTDGTLNIPIIDPNSPSSAVLNALNALDGFSTVAPGVATFSAAIDPATVRAGDTVRMFEVGVVNPFAGDLGAPFAVTGAVAELVGGQDFNAGLLAVDTSARTLVVTPLKPLKPKTGYMVVLTDGIRAASGGSAPLPAQTYIFARFREPLIDGAGHSLFRRLTDAQAQALEPIRRIVVSQEDAAADAGVVRGSIVLSWSFLTQSIDDVSKTIRANAQPQTLTLAPSGLNTAALGLGLPGAADIYAGALQIPYYLQAPTATNPTALLTGHWHGVNGSELTRYNSTPVATQNLTIPVLASVPNAASGHSEPAGGWPVVIFQHGITQNRTNLFAVADALAAAGFAAVAIDLPLHGITDTANPFYQAALERTFNADLVNNDSNAPGPDGKIDPSGTYFINLNSLLSSRDNLRQGAADLQQLLIALPAVDFNGDQAPDFDANRVHFVGHSLGGIVGTVFLGIEDGAVGAATLAMPGGGVAKLLENSPSFGPLIRAGLAAAGLEAGTSDFEAFFRAAQQVVDAGDPINYGAMAADTHPIHMIEVIGPPPDQVIPNSVADAPLSGTEPLARIMELGAVGATLSDANGIRGIVRFVAGAHSSILSPQASPAATVEMQTEMAGFMASDGTLLRITNPGVVQPAP